MFTTYDSNRRYRRKAQEKRRKVMVLMFVLVAIFASGYWLGGEVVRSSEMAYKQRALKLQSKQDEMEALVTESRTKVKETQLRYQQLEERYEAEVPMGELKELSDLVAKQLKDGIAKDRLSFVITSARPPRNCSSPVTKRFIVPTAVYKGVGNAVAFANGSITVTGSGESAVSASGEKEAWFDPGKPVKIKFTRLGGKDTVKEGLMPIHYSMVTDGREYRFTVAKGKRSFVTVTSDNCDYP